MASLSPDVAAEVRDLLIKPPPKDPYDKLRRELTTRTGLSQSKQLQQLLNAEQMGDRTPSQLLRRMKQLLGDNAPLMDDKLLTQLFIQRPPPNLRMVLASSSNYLSIEALAWLADKMMEAIGSSTCSSTVYSTHDDNTVGAVGSSPPHPPSSLESEIIGLRQDVAELRSLIRQLHLDKSRPSSDGILRRRYRGRSRSSSRNAPLLSTESELCWYHDRFGKDARRCNSPCTWGQTQGNASAGQ